MALASNVQSTQYETIMQTILGVGLAAGIPFVGSKLWEIPLPGEIEDAGIPYLAVRAADLERWGTGEWQGDMRLPGWIEPVWCAEIAAIYTYSDSAPNHGPAADA